MERGQRALGIILELLKEILPRQHLQRVGTWRAAGESTGSEDMMCFLRAHPLYPDWGRAAHHTKEDERNTEEATNTLLGSHRCWKLHEYILVDAVRVPRTSPITGALPKKI